MYQTPVKQQALLAYLSDSVKTLSFEKQLAKKSPLTEHWNKFAVISA